ncbi:MAG TPA: EAL domain-containing protein [Solirubrobacteraceae bacterium]|jgi:EAL domain-containing protein (putative c-di-GMP-specific phosphodiesterase class I)|nr:EAL domain-containing protein [Solirubrobacteraceae bacterium]
MLEAPQPPGAKGSIDDPTVAMQRIIDQAMDLVASSDALTSQDEAALARLTGFVSTVAGAMWDLSGTAGEALGTTVMSVAGEGSRAQASMSERVNEFIANVFRVAQASADLALPGRGSVAARPAVSPEVAPSGNAPRPSCGADDLGPTGIAPDVAVRQSVEAILSQARFAVRCQPIVRLDTGAVVGAEALTRFPSTHRPAEAWFDDAQRVGLGAELQLAVVERAVALVGLLPAGAFLTFNVGPEVLAGPELLDLLDLVDPERVIIELTEHVRIDDYDRLLDNLSQVRERGARLAVDDTGAGFASLGHILHLRPELIKLDCQFTRGIDTDPARRSLAHALVTFARDIGAEVVSEGIETAAELDTVRELGVPYGQGYFLNRPTRPQLIPDSYAHVAARAAMSSC